MKIIRYITAVSLVALSCSAAAGGSASLSSSSGPNDYRSYTFRGSIDLAKPLRLNVDHFLASSTDSDYTHQTGAGFNWKTTDLISTNYRYSQTNDGTFQVNGNEGYFSLALDTLWDGELQTNFDAGYGDFRYKAADPGPNSADRTLVQNRFSYGISQELTTSFSLYAYHDHYQYDHNVIPLAYSMIIRSRNTSDAAYALLAFPDFTNTAGFSWYITDNFSVNASASRTITLLQQELGNKNLSVKYKFNKTFSLGANVSRSTSTTLTGPLGKNILQDETSDIYRGLTASLTF